MKPESDENGDFFTQTVRLTNSLLLSFMAYPTYSSIGFGIAAHFGELFFDDIAGLSIHFFVWRVSVDLHRREES